MNRNAEAKLRAQSSKKTNWDAYVDNHKDLSAWHQDGAKEGLIANKDSQYAKIERPVSKNVDGMEQQWVDKMNKHYGTSHTDMNQFTKAQFGEVHYNNFGKKEGRKTDFKQMPITGKPDMRTGDNVNIKGNTVEQTQEVTQDNDITTNVNGNNNTVISEQDNSIRQYGGDNRSFTYYGGRGGNRYEDTPVSAATMGGFYDVDDSPSAQAKFNDMFTTMNRDNQKRYAGDAMKTYAKYGNTDARSYTNESMENALGRSTQYSFDRADRQTGQVFGDIWNDDWITEDWKMPTPPKAIESNAADIAKQAKDDIEDI